MPVFGQTSQRRLATCDPRLREICAAAIEHYDFSVICGHRGEADQNAAFVTGHSMVEWPKSRHNTVPSVAVDVAPYPIDWEGTSRFFYLAGILKVVSVELGYKLRWGGDWDGDGDFGDQTFDDLAHFEIVD